MRWIKSFIISILGLTLLLTFTFSEENPDKSAIIARLQQHYWDRVKLFEEENQTMKKVVLLGDSITEGFKVDQTKWVEGIEDSGVTDIKRSTRPYKAEVFHIWKNKTGTFKVSKFNLPDFELVYKYYNNL